MNPRQFMFAMVGVLLVLMTVITALQIPPYVVPVIILPVVVGGIYWMRKTQAKNAQVPLAESAPELEQRVRAACGRVGRPDATVNIVTGGGRAFIAVHGTNVNVSPALGELMTDAELDALLLQEFAAPPNANRTVWLEILSVPALILVALTVLSLVLNLPLYGLGMLLAIIWIVAAAQLGLATRRTAKRVFEAYTARGGAAVPLVSAMMKLYSAGIRFTTATKATNELTRAEIAGQMQKHVAQLAALAGLTREELVTIGDAAGAIPELYAPERLPVMNRVLPYAWVIFFGGLIALIVVSVFVAMLLSSW